MKSKHIVIPIFVPHKGCPHDCIFCNQKKISGQLSEITQTDIKEIVYKHLSLIDKSNTTVEIGFYGGSFTGIPKEQQIKMLSTANEFMECGQIDEIRLSTRPDYIDSSILDYLSEYGVKTIELGVQSMDDEVLAKTCRGHTSKDVDEACKIIKQSKLKLGVQVMTGLPGSTREKEISTVTKLCQYSPEIARIYPTLVIKDTYLEKMYKTGEYKPLGLNEAVDICSVMLDIFNTSKIRVIRIGLQPTDNINEREDVLAGPFHPAFRQLVESRLALVKIESQIVENKLFKLSKIIILTSKKNISNVAGQKRSNIEYLKEKYGFKEIKILGNEKVEDIIVINVGGNEVCT